MSENPWSSEFAAFLAAPAVPPPRSLEQRVLQAIHEKLYPSLTAVFFRLCCIHAVVSVVTLALCPHFGLSIIPGFAGMSALFMHFGEAFCMTACGLTFMALGLFLTTFLMPSEYVYVLRRHRLLWAPVLTILSCGVLMMVGNVFLSTLPLWLLGGIVGAYGSLALAPRLRYA